MAQVTPKMLITLHDNSEQKHSLIYDRHGGELAFMVDSTTQINLRDIDTSQSIADQLAQAVSADANNLFTHTRRIFFHFQQGHGDGLYSALTDLFLVLGKRGLPIRSRLLQGARLYLADQHYQALRAYLCQGREPTEEELPEAAGSVLTHGVEGRCKLITRVEPSDRELRDPLLEAREYIEFSQIEQARDLLEKCVLEQPDREDLQQELLSVYGASRDRARYLAMRAKLEQILDTLPQCWLTFSIN